MMDLAMGLQIQRETRYARARPELSQLCVQKNCDARPDVNPGIHTQTRYEYRDPRQEYTEVAVCVQRTPMQTRRQQRQKQTDVNDDREQRDGCTN